MTRWALAVRVVLGVLFCATASHAHEVRPAYLEIREVSPTSYEVAWKRPVRGGVPLAVAPVFPTDCNHVSTRSHSTSAFTLDRSLVDCREPLAGRLVRVDGLAATMADVLVRVSSTAGESRTTLLRGGRDTVELARQLGAGEVALSYYRLGIEHILLGVDHLLFVLGMLMLLDGWRRLVGAVTAFTVAHSLTLALASLGLVAVPQAPVEAVIALSIAFLATEYVHRIRGREGWTSRRPWGVSFVVGLLHGLGFAGALSEVGLPSGDIPLALLSFNLGVETGQLAFVAFVLVAMLVGRHRVSWSPRAPLIGAYAMGSLAAYWFVERVVAMG